MEHSHKQIESLIYYIRGHKVMLDYDLATLYGTETRTLNQAVKRNSGRFPTDFCFQLSENEAEILRSQFVIAKSINPKVRYLPFAYTELGIAMLSGVLKTEKAILVHISIIRVFFQMRQLLKSEQNLLNELRKLEDNSNKLFKIVFERIDALEAKEMLSPPKRKIGF